MVTDEDIIQRLTEIIDYDFRGGELQIKCFEKLESAFETWGKKIIYENFCSYDDQSAEQRLYLLDDGTLVEAYNNFISNLYISTESIAGKIRQHNESDKE